MFDVCERLVPPRAAAVHALPDSVNTAEVFKDKNTQRDSHQSLGSLSNDDGEVNENGKKTVGLDWQNNNFAHPSSFFAHFFAVTARLGRENAQFHDLSRTGTQDNNFPFFWLNFDIVI